MDQVNHESILFGYNSCVHLNIWFENMYPLEKKYFGKFMTIWKNKLSFNKPSKMTWNSHINPHQNTPLHKYSNQIFVIKTTYYRNKIKFKLMNI